MGSNISAHIAAGPPGHCLRPAGGLCERAARLRAARELPARPQGLRRETIRFHEVACLLRLQELAVTQLCCEVIGERGMRGADRKNQLGVYTAATQYVVEYKRDGVDAGRRNSGCSTTTTQPHTGASAGNLWVWEEVKGQGVCSRRVGGCLQHAGCVGEGGVGGG